MGKALVSSLLSQGHFVTIISRDPEPAFKYFYYTPLNRKPSADKITWDDIEREGLPPSTDIVINLAGSKILDFKKLWTCKYKEECVSSRVRTTALLAKAISESKEPPSVWIATSAVSLYPPSKTIEYGEGDGHGGSDDHWASQLCASIEEAAKLSDEEKCPRSVIMRLGIVLGQDGGVYDNMHMPFYCCLGGTIGDGSQWFPYVHLNDVVRAYEFAMFDTRVKGPLNVVAPSACTNKDFTKALGRAMWRPTFLYLPSFVSSLVGKERGSILFSGQHVNPTALTSLGFQFNFSDITSCCTELVKHDGSFLFPTVNNDTGSVGDSDYFVPPRLEYDMDV